MEQVKAKLKQFKQWLVAATIIIMVLLAGFFAVPILFPPTPPTGATNTFGNLVAGSVYSDICNVMRGSVFTISEQGTANSITASLRLYYMGDANTVTIRAAIYKHSDNTSVANSSSNGYTATFVQGWKIFTFNSESLTVNTAYVLEILATSDASPEDQPLVRFYYNASGDTNQGHYQSVTAFPSTASFTHSNYNYSIYCTYTVYVPPSPVADGCATNSSYAGVGIAFYSHWTDQNFTGCYFNFTWNATSTPETITDVLSLVNISSAWSNITRISPFTVGTVIQYSFTANNTLGLSGSTGLKNLTLTTTQYSVGLSTDDLCINDTGVHEADSTLQLGYLDIPRSFGYETLGAASTSIEDHIKGTVFNITKTGVAQSITAGLKWNAAAYTGKINCAIYLHSNLSLVNVTQERTIALTSTITWYVFNFTDPKATLTLNTEYVLGVWAESVTGDATVGRDDGATCQAHYQDLSYGTFPNPLNVTGQLDYQYSLFCNYTVPPSTANATMRWTNLFATRYSTIDNVTVQFKGATAMSGSTSVIRIYGLDSDTLGSDWYTEYSWYDSTTAYVDWTLPTTVVDGLYSTPNLATIIQEIMARDGWTHANNWGLKFFYQSGTGYRTFKSYDGGFGCIAYTEWNALSESAITPHPENETIVSAQIIQFSYQWYDWHYSGGMDKFLYETNNTGVNTNSSWTSVSANGSYVYFTNFTLQINSSDPWIVTLKVYANSSTSAWLSTPTLTTYPLYNEYNSTVLTTVDNSVNLYALSHTTGRKVFHDNNTDTFIQFYCDSMHMAYIFSKDGFTWQNYTALRSATLGDNFYITLEPHSGYTYVHYEFGGEGWGGQDCKIYYRRGNITLMDATYNITWQTTENLVYDPTGQPDELCTYPEGIVADHNGIVYLIVENGTYVAGMNHDNLTMLLWRNSLTNGSWSTTAGFPKNITMSGLGLWECSPLILSSNTVAVVMASGQNTGEETDFVGLVYTWFWNGTTTWYENSSSVPTYFRDSISAVVDDNDQIHVVFHSNDGRVLYARRNTNNVWDRTADQIWNQDISVHWADYGGTSTVPQIFYDASSYRIFVNWIANDTYLYLNYKGINTTNWVVRPLRILNVGVCLPLPNVCTERSINNYALFASTSGTAIVPTLITYHYNMATVTFENTLTVGWNNFTAQTPDVGHTLGDVNASLNIDAINWTFCVLVYTNGTRYVFIRNYSINANIEVTSTDDTFYVCCTDADIWNHTYP